MLNSSKETGSNEVMQGLLSLAEIFGLDSKTKERPLKGFQQRRNMTTFFFFKKKKIAVYWLEIIRTETRGLPKCHCSVLGERWQYE